MSVHKHLIMYDIYTGFHFNFLISRFLGLQPYKIVFDTNGKKKYILSYYWLIYSILIYISLIALNIFTFSTAGINKDIFSVSIFSLLHDKWLNLLIFLTASDTHDNPRKTCRKLILVQECFVCKTKNSLNFEHNNFRGSGSKMKNIRKKWLYGELSNSFN